jgi:hypothetical protein
MEKVLAIFAYLANLILPDSWAYIFARLVSTKDELPQGDNRKTLIIPVAHGTTGAGLTNGSVATAWRVYELQSQFPASAVVFGSFRGGKTELEKRLKMEIMNGIDVRYYGTAMSTIDEPVGVLGVIGDEKFDRVIFVTDEAHSYRGGKIIFKTFFPDTPLYVAVIPLQAAVDPGSLMENYWNPWKALIFQVAPTPLYWWWARMGPEYLATKAHFHQPIATDRGGE